MHALSAIGVGLLVGTVRLLGRHRPRVQQRLRKHLFVADDGRPWWVALQTRQVVLSRLRVQVRDAVLRLLPAQLLVTASRLALPVRSLLRRRGSSVGLRLNSGLGVSIAVLLLRFRGRAGLLGLCSALALGWERDNES